MSSERTPSPGPPRTTGGGAAVPSVTAVTAGTAVALFVLGSLSYLPAGYLLRYANLALTDRPGRAAAIALGALAVALLHERVVRGALYPALRVHLRAGMPAALTAVAGALVPLAARLLLFPVPGVNGVVVVTHAALVEVALSLGVCWLALATGRTLPGAIALSLVWLCRAVVVVSFKGGAVPLMEILAALAGGWLAAWVLRDVLEPHRAALLGE